MIENVKSYSVSFASKGSDPCVTEILSFAFLPVGWCHGYGRPSTMACSLSALRILHVLRDQKFDRIESFPDPNGSVLLSAFFGDDSVEILCRSGNTFDFMLEQPGIPAVIEEDLDEKMVQDNIWKVSHRGQTASSDCYTRVYTVNTSGVSKVPHSKTLTMGYQLLSQFAPSQKAEMSAITYQCITLKTRATPQYTGEYQSANSLLRQHLSTSPQQQETAATTSLSELVTIHTESGSYLSNWQTSKYVPLTA